jgi:hypothetical protein
MEASLARDPVAAVLLRQHIDLTAKHLTAVLCELQG